VLAVPALTRLRPSRLCRVLGYAVRNTRAAAAPDETAVARVQRALAIAGRVRRQTCLTRSVARFLLLRRAGYPVELVFGLGPQEGIWAGHCWLELDGKPYLEDTDPRPLFPQMLRVPAAQEPA
jgi:hypothetical protein